MRSVYIAAPFFPFIYANAGDGYPAYADDHASVLHAGGDGNVHRMMKGALQSPCVHDHDAGHHDHGGVHGIPPDECGYGNDVQTSGDMLQLP